LTALAESENADLEMEIAFQDLVLEYCLVMWGGDDVEDYRSSVGCNDRVWCFLSTGVIILRGIFLIPA